MRKTLILFAFILLAAGLRAQDFYVVDSLYCYTHDPVTQAPTPTERQYNLAFTQDDGEVLESGKEERPSWTPQWRNSTYTTYVYDGQNNLIEQTEQRWDTLANDWKNYKRTQNTPNPNGDYTLVLNQQWSNGSWQNIDKVISTFNANGHIETLSQELWDAGMNSWQKNFRIVYATNAGGQFLQTKFQLWNPGTSDFYDISRTTYTYSGTPALESENRTEIYNSVSSQWEKSSRSVKNYDTSGNLTEVIVQLWNTIDSDWLNQNRTLQNFNTDNQVTLRTELIWNGTQWVNYFQTNNIYDANANLARFEVSQWQVNLWKLLNSCDFYWRFHHVVAVEETQEGFCKIPNPYKPGTVVFCENLPAGKASQLAIYDMTGKLVCLEKLENQQINISKPLPAGMYILSLRGETGVFFTQKILITP